MSLLLYGSLFWIFAVISILLKIQFQIKTELRTIIKAVPAFLAVSFVFSLQSFSLFHVLLMIALVFCMLGDIGMEYNILPGLGLFLIAHIFFTSNFFIHSVILGFSLLPSVAFVASFIVMVIYSGFLFKYLKSSDLNTPAKLLRAVIFYAIVISLTLSTSIFLWLSTDSFLGFIPVLGALFFVVSDSLIGIREFHHQFQYQHVLTLSTYYLAIFLLSMGVVAFMF
ncbi:MAG: lysoplasmalogenase family protein [Candidatus Thorarchaeota archaeon]